MLTSGIKRLGKEAIPSRDLAEEITVNFRLCRANFGCCADKKMRLDSSSHEGF